MRNIVIDNASARVSAVQNIIHVRVLQAADNAAELEVLERAIERGAQTQQGTCGLMLTMDKFEASPSAEKRQLVVGMMQRLSTYISAVAIVPASDGIKATITRSVLNTILLASRLRTTKIFSDLEGASFWMVDRLTEKGIALSAYQIAEDSRALIRAPKQAPVSRPAINGARPLV